MDAEKDKTEQMPAQAGGERKAEGAPPRPGSKGAPMTARRKAAIGAGCAAIACALAVGIGIAATSGGAPQDQEAAQAQEGSLYKSSLVEEKDEEATVALALSYEAPGRLDGASPAICRIQGTTDGNRAVDYYHAMSSASESVEIVPGTYTVTWVSMINPDGSIERAGGSAGAVTVAEGASPAAKGSYEHVDAADVADGELERIVEAVADAVKKGDGTLKGDAGRDAAEKAAAGAKANPKADSARIDESKQAADSSASQPVGATGSDPTGSASNGPTTGDLHQPSSSSGSAAATTTQASAPADSSQQSGAGQASGSAGGSSASEPAQEQQHVHSWAPVYRTETSSYEVVDQAAWDEPVYTQQEREICNGCGADLTGTDPWDHIGSQMLAGNYACGGFHTKWETVCTGTTHHDAVTHTETTSQQVLDHYECSCGARR